MSNDLFIEILRILIPAVILFFILLYFRKIIFFSWKYNQRKKYNLEKRKQVAGELHEDLVLFMQEHYIRTRIFWVKIHHMLNVTYQEGYEGKIK